MRLHVLAGCRELLQPKALTPEQAGSLIGPRVKTATASWLSPNPDGYYHTVLQDAPGDGRTRIMALALKDGFGTRFEPLLVLPDLLDEIEKKGERPLPRVAVNRRSQVTVLSEIWAHGYLRQLRLYCLALPANADPDGSWAVPAGIVTSAVRDRVEKLRAVCIADMGSDAVQTQVIEANPDIPFFGTVYDNSVSNQLALRLALRLREEGWTSNVEILPGAIVNVLANWNKKGISPILPLHADHLDAMTKLIYAKLL